MKLNAPIYRAKKINIDILSTTRYTDKEYEEAMKPSDSDEYVEGFYCSIVDENSITKHLIILSKSEFNYIGSFCVEAITKYLEIDPSTLSMSFNGGVTWRTFEEIRDGLSFLGAPTILTDKDN